MAAFNIFPKMEALKDLNKISPSLQSWIDKNRPTGLKPARFRAIGGHENLDLETKGKTPIHWPQIITIPGTDRIVDTVDGRKQQVAIGHVQTVDTQTDKPIFSSIKIHAAQSDGYLYLYADDVEDMLKFDYLMISNYNESNPYRNKSIAPMFTFIDEKALKNKRVETTDTLMRAIQLLHDMNAVDTRNMAIIYGIDKDQDPSDVRADLFEKINATPSGAQAFIDVVGNKDLKVRVNLKEALSQSLITYNTEENSLAWPDGSTFATLARTEGKDTAERFADWVNTAPNGQEVYANIEGQLNPKTTKRGSKSGEETK